MILIVTYDLRSPQDYHNFYEVVKQQGKWWHYMASTWLLSTQKTPQEVVDAILPHMDVQDLLLVCELSNKYQGRLPKPAWEWIKQELPEYANLAALSSLLGTPGVVPGSLPSSSDVGLPGFTPLGGGGFATLADLLGTPKKEEPILPWMTPPPKK
jgi:hypothetical protein